MSVGIDGPAPRRRHRGSRRADGNAGDGRLPIHAMVAPCR